MKQPAESFISAQKDRKIRERNTAIRRERSERGKRAGMKEVCVVNTVDWGALRVLFYFSLQHDLFDLLSINQQRMCINELEVYWRKASLWPWLFVFSYFPWKRAVIKTGDIGVLCFLGDWKECRMHHNHITLVRSGACCQAPGYRRA